MSIESMGANEVLALRFDEPSASHDLAHWCGGRVDDDSAAPVVWVPTSAGPKPAVLGDWIVRHEQQGFLVMSHEDFSARHTSAD